MEGRQTGVATMHCINTSVLQSIYSSILSTLHVNKTLKRRRSNVLNHRATKTVIN